MKLEKEEPVKAPESFYSLDGLLNDFTSRRKILICGTIDNRLALDVMLLLSKLEKENSTEPIYLFIDSPGGSVQAGLTIIDCMNYVKAPVYTFCYSMAASMAAVILAAGEKRFAFEHSTIMIHQPSRLIVEQYVKQSDLSEAARSAEETRKTLEELLAKSTKGKTSIQEMHKACEKDNYLTAEQALKMGLIDEIITKK